MANHKRKPNYKAKRSCGLCKPWKRVGNSGKLENRNDKRAALMLGQAKGTPTSYPNYF